MNVQVYLQTFTDAAKRSLRFVSSLRVVLVFDGCVERVLRFFLLGLYVQLPDGEDAGQHGLHGAVIQRGGGEPQRAVGHAAALRVKVEHVGALLYRLRAGRKTNLIEHVLQRSEHFKQNSSFRVPLTTWRGRTHKA